MKMKIMLQALIMIRKPEWIKNLKEAAQFEYYMEIDDTANQSLHKFKGFQAFYFYFSNIYCFDHFH